MDIEEISKGIFVIGTIVMGIVVLFTLLSGCAHPALGNWGLNYKW